MKPFNVRVAIIEPGIIDTAMAGGLANADMQSIYPHLARFSDVFTASLKNPIPPTLLRRRYSKCRERHLATASPSLGPMQPPGLELAQQLVR